jgi:hypothetical protein
MEMLIRQVDWEVQPASTDKKDVENAEFLESCLKDMSMTWQDTVSEILSMLVFGWSLHEIVYKKRNGFNKFKDKKSKFNDGKIGWAKLPIRAQETLYQWDFDEKGNVIAFLQQAPPFYNVVKIPMAKALLFRTKAHKGNPEGRSVLRNAYRSWYFKKNMETIEGIGVERDLAGLPIAFVPPEILDPTAGIAEKTTLNEIKKIVRNIRRDEQEGIVFPMFYDENGKQMYDLQLLSSGGKRQFDTDSIIKRYDSRIAMTILADFILMGHEKVGSFALSNNKTNLFGVALGAWLNEIEEVLNGDAIPQLFALNGENLENLPKLVHGDIEAISLKDLGEFIKTLSGSGMELFPDEILENYLRKAGNLPLKGEQ